MMDSCIPVSVQLLMRTVCVLTLFLAMMDVVVSRPNSGSSTVSRRSSFGTGESEPHLLGTGISRRKRDLDELVLIVERTAASLDPQTAYRSFYRSLKAFTSSVVGKFKTGAPRALNNISALTKIVLPEDFSKQNDFIKITKVLKYTKGILSKIGKFIRRSSQTWFKLQKWTLDLKINSCLTSIANLGPHNSQLGGIGGVNSGVSSSTSLSVLRQLKKLIDALQS